MGTRRGYIVRKHLTDLGAIRGARDAFRPRRRPLEPDIVLTDERLRIHPSVFWFGAAAMYATAALTLLLMQLLDRFGAAAIPRELTSTTALTVLILTMALSGFWLYMAGRGSSALPWMNLIVGLGTLLVGALAASAGSHGPDVLAYLIVPAIAAAFFMPLRQAIPHLSAIVLLMLVVAARNAGEGVGAAIAINIMLFTLLAAAMLVVARMRIQAGILHNVELAGSDPLTGVANLRKFNEQLQAEIFRAQRTGDNLTLLMIDLDEFKRVNDEHSYALGDAVLVACARAMKRVVRGHELLARRGGDEFAVVAVGADLECANALAERLRTAVRRERQKLCPDVSPEISIGCAQWRIGDQSDDLLRRADGALHVSKEVVHGRRDSATGER